MVGKEPMMLHIGYGVYREVVQPAYVESVIARLLEQNPERYITAAVFVPTDLTLNGAALQVERGYLTVVTELRLPVKEV